MSRTLTRQIARQARQQTREMIIERDFKDIKTKFPNAIKAWITYGGNLSDRMREEARGALPASRRQIRTLLKQRRDELERRKRRAAFEKAQKAFKAQKEAKQKTSLIRKMFRRGVA